MTDSVRYLTGPPGKQTRPKIVEFRHLTVMLEKQPVLEDITLDIFEGEFVILVGKPASGKSVLLGCVQGLIQPAHGEIVVSGTQLPPLPSELARQIGVLPHYFDNRAAETVLHYLQRFAAYHELQLSEGQLQEYCAHYQLVPSLPIAQLTAFQERVFALAMALIHDPRLVLLDEPLQGLPEQDYATFWSYLQRMQREGRTLLCACPEEITPMSCDRVIYIS